MSGLRTSRRSLLRVSAAAAAGSLVVDFVLPLSGSGAATATGMEWVPNAFIRVNKEGVATLVMPQVEMGQGTYTSLSQLIAEEMDLPLAHVSLEHAPVDAAKYSNSILKEQITGGSTSIRAFWPVMREAGASARNVLVQAAAERLGVMPGTLRTENGAVIGTAGRIAYGDLVDDAARFQPKDVQLKAPDAWTLIGTRARRLDTPDKVTGRTVYGIDARPPGVRVATLRFAPVLGGKVRSVDSSRARQVKGVTDIVVLDDLVAVAGEHMWAAKQGLEALDVDWDDGANAQVDSDALWAKLRADAEGDGLLVQRVGAGAPVGGGDVIEATYELPLLAHAPMEPMNCTVHVRPDACEVWVGIQVVGRAQAAAARESGLPPERVTIHNHYIGGGFGRRLEADMVAVATRIARHVDAPVKVVWTREEDIRHNMMRPMYHNRLSARLRDGKPVAWSHKIAGSSVMARFAAAALENGVDPDAVDGAREIVYDIPDRTLRFVRSEPAAVQTAFWRGVGANNNIFSIESFMDRLARAAGADPLAFRRALLSGNARARVVLDLAAEKASWGDPLPARSGRGISLQSAFKSFVATVAAVRVSDDGHVAVERMTTVIDCGTVINPDTVEAQIQGGLVFALTAALYGNITLERGRVQQGNFNDYRMLRIDEMPKIDVHVMPSREDPGGVGEPGTASVLGAVNNAIFSATGVQLDRMPIGEQKLRLRRLA